MMLISTLSNQFLNHSSCVSPPLSAPPYAKATESQGVGNPWCSAVPALQAENLAKQSGLGDPKCILSGPQTNFK